MSYIVSFNYTSIYHRSIVANVSCVDSKLHYVRCQMGRAELAQARLNVARYVTCTVGLAWHGHESGRTHHRHGMKVGLTRYESEMGTA